MPRVIALIFGLGLVAATAAPALRPPEQDSYPFSSYPMFAKPRGKPLLYTAEGLTSDHSIAALPPRLVANGEVMQALQTLRRAADGGSQSLRRLCQRIATRVAEAPEYAAVRQVQIVRERFDPIAYFEVGPTPEERKVLRHCKVVRKK
jgi:hypothetical protein